MANNQPAANPARAFYVTELAGCGGRSTWVTVLSRADGSNATQLGGEATTMAGAVSKVWTLAEAGDTYTLRPLGAEASTIAIGAPADPTPAPMDEGAG